MSYLYGYPQYVVDRDTGLPVVNGRGGTATDPASGAPLEITTPDGVPTELATGPTGLLIPVKISATRAVAHFGGVASTVFSDLAHDSSQSAVDALAIATESRALAEAARAAAEALIGQATVISFTRRDSDNRVYFTSAPVASGGGTVIYGLDGRVYVRFA